MTERQKTKGFSLVEVVIAMLMGLVVAIIASSLLLSGSSGIENRITVSNAEKRAEEALSTLTAKVADLPIAGSYEPVSEAEISLLPCSAATCDFVLEPDAPEEMRTSAAGGVPFSERYTPPAGFSLAFVRRWRVVERSGEYRLRIVGVALLKNLETNEPVVFEETTIPLGE